MSDVWGLRRYDLTAFSKTPNGNFLYFQLLRDCIFIILHHFSIYLSTKALTQITPHLSSSEPGPAANNNKILNNLLLFTRPLAKFRFLQIIEFFGNMCLVMFSRYVKIFSTKFRYLFSANITCLILKCIISYKCWINWYLVFIRCLSFIFGSSLRILNLFWQISACSFFCRNGRVLV